MITFIKPLKTVKLTAVVKGLNKNSRQQLIITKVY